MELGFETILKEQVETFMASICNVNNWANVLI